MCVYIYIYVYIHACIHIHIYTAIIYCLYPIISYYINHFIISRVGLVVVDEREDAAFVRGFGCDFTNYGFRKSPCLC